jgi:hypothetical protein
MALPFLAGIAIGSLVVVAYNNKSVLKEKLTQGAQKAKEVAQCGIEKAKEVAQDTQACLAKKEPCSPTKEKTPSSKEKA